uniref:Dynein light chain n=1 Tax=Syphacia muris TaxID=451379 RepID=A0A0N5B0P8_9BILA
SSFFFNSTSLNTVHEITKNAFERCGIENEIATFIKTAADNALGPSWQCIVGRNFGSHIVYQYYTYLTMANITVILFKCC